MAFSTYKFAFTSFGAIALYAASSFGSAAFPAEVTKTARPKLITLVEFTGADGARPSGGLTMGSEGNLFGTSYFGGSKNDGTIFEVVKTQSGYANTPTTLVSFHAADGEFPGGSLIADTAGNFYGTTIGGGANNDGTVFKLAKTNDGYASKPTVLVSFTGIDGANPYADLIADGAGNLYGTTSQGGSDNDGTVFMLARTEDGYASTPTTLVSFTGADGSVPYGSLIFDAAGNLFGTTYGGGAANEGTVFEIDKTQKG